MATKQPEPPIADKVAPESREAEEALLGGILINSEYLPAVASYLQPTDFFYLANQWIWEAMLALHERGDGVDNLTVVEELHARRKLEQVGNGIVKGSSYITRLINNTPTHVHTETYARIVETAAIRRRALDALGDIAQSFLAEDAALPDIIEKAHDTLSAATKIKQDGDFKTITEFASVVYDEVEDRYNHPGYALGIPTGLDALDNQLVGKGWGKGELILIAARPSMGKSALALNTGVYAAKQGKHVAIITMEMTGEDLQYRLLAAESGINAEKIKNGDLTGNEYDRFLKATADTEQLPLTIDDSGRVNARQMIAKCHRLHREWGIDVLLVDYIQMMFSDDKKADNRNLELADISRSLKQLAMEFKIPVIALAQLNRGVEGRADKRPMLSDLRDSGALEQDADTVIFIYRDDFYNDNSERPGTADLIFAKQRHGRTGIVTVGWVGNVMKFVDIKERLNLGDYQ
jgi:replicative DNA helicase